MIYAAIDTETTGIGERCQLLELAIVLEDTAEGGLTPVEDLPSFSAIVNVHEGAWWELYPIAMHLKNGLLDELSGNKKLPSFDEVDSAAALWLAQHGHNEPRKLTPAGKNFAGFDKRFLGPRVTRLLHHRAIDPGSVFVDFAKGVPGMNDLLDYSEKGAIAHRALEDARDVVRVLRRRYA